METARHGLPRSPEKQQRAATDLTNHKVLSRRETHRLTKTLRRNKDLSDIDIEILIASTVEFGYTPKELATELLNQWDMGSRPEHAGAILVMMVMDENRIEVEVSDSLAHIFGADWCHEMLYMRVVPWFKQDRYDRGLEELLDAIGSTMNQVRNNNNKPSKSKRKRRVGLAALMGAYGLTHPFWWRWFEKDHKDESSGDCGDDNNEHHFWGDDSKGIGGRRHGWEQNEPLSSRNNSALYGLGSFLLGRKLGSRSAWRSKTAKSCMTAGARAPHWSLEDRTATVGKWPYVFTKGRSSPIRGCLLHKSIRTEEHTERLDKEADQRNENKQNTNAGGTKTNTPRSSGWGGGASWSRDLYSTKKNISSSGFGSGATWSHNYSHAKGNKNKKAKNPTTSQTKGSRESSSSNGGGATW